MDGWIEQAYERLAALDADDPQDSALAVELLSDPEFREPQGPVAPPAPSNAGSRPHSSVTWRSKVWPASRRSHRPAAARRSRRGPRPPRRTGPCSPPPRSSAGRRSRPRPRTPRAPRRTPSPPGPRPPLHHRGCPRHRHRCSRRDRRPGPRQPPARRDDSVTGARTRGTQAGDPQAAGHRPLTGRYADTSDGGCRTSRDSSNDLLTRTCVPLRVGVASPRRREPPVSWIRL
jgi:hypothetical protein